LRGRTLAAAHDHPLPRINLFVSRRFSDRDIMDQPLDVARRDLGDTAVAEQRHDVMPQAPDGELLGQRLHRITLPHTALDVAALLLVEVD